MNWERIDASATELPLTSGEWVVLFHPGSLEPFRMARYHYDQYGYGGDTPGYFFSDTGGPSLGPPSHYMRLVAP